MKRKEIIISLVGIICVAFSVFLNLFFDKAEVYQSNFVNLILGIFIGTYASSIIYYRWEFFNEIEAIWSMLISDVSVGSKYSMAAGAPYFDSDFKFVNTTGNSKTIKTRFDRGAEWYFFNGWKRGHLVEVYDITTGESEAPPIFIVRYSDLTGL